MEYKEYITTEQNKDIAEAKANLVTDAHSLL